MHFTCTDEHLIKKGVPAVICNSLSKTFGLYTKNCRTSGEEIQHVRQSCILPARRIILKKNNFSKQLCFSNIFETKSGKYFDQEQPCLFTVDKIAFSNSGAQFLVFFSNNFDIFHQFCDFSKNFPYLAQKFRRSRQKGILRVRRNTWWKIGLRLQSVTVFNNIWTLHKYLSDFWLESAARSSELHFTYTEDHFEEKQLLETT